MGRGMACHARTRRGHARTCWQRLSVLVVLLACAGLLAEEKKSPEGWVLKGQLPAKPRFVTDKYPLSDQPNSGKWHRYWHQPLTLNFDSETMPKWFGLPKDKHLPSTYSIKYVRAWKKRKTD